LISLNLLKLRSAVLCTVVIGKLRMPHHPFHGRPLGNNRISTPAPAGD